MSVKTLTPEEQLLKTTREKLSKYALLGNIDFVYDIQGEVIKPMSPLLYEEIIKEVKGEKVEAPSP